LTSFLENLGYGPGRKRVLNVEDWAEIRRLRRSERSPISEIALGVGDFAEHGEGGVGLQLPAEVPACGGRVGGR
jgi:hypothetical protein